MDRNTAERWVVISALVVAAVYAYRRLTEAASPPVTLKKLAGVGGLAPAGSFVTAWGFTYLTLAIVTEAAPGLGGSFAILIMTTELLTNGADLFKDVGVQQTTGTPAAAQPPTAPTSPQARQPLQPLQATVK